MVSCSDIYVYDRTLGQTTRVSVATDGTQGNGESREPEVSADGRYVVFVSDATNLVLNDTNGATDIFVHDRVLHTTTRVTQTSAGQANGISQLPRMSPDGRFIGFVSAATNLTATLDTTLCSGTGVMAGCKRPYLYDRTTGAITGVPVPANNTNGTAGIRAVELANNGRLVFTMTDEIGGLSTGIGVYDRLTGRASVLDGRPHTATFVVSPDGRYYFIGAGSQGLATIPGALVDRLLNLRISAPPLGTLNFFPEQFAPDNLQYVTSGGSTVIQVYRGTRDSDGDGMPDDWETTFGLNPNANDASADPDGDGRTNLQEYQDGTNPVGTFKRYFAEGAVNAFFSTQFPLFNPNNQAATVLLEYQGSNGQRTSELVTVAANARTTIALLDNSWPTQPDNDFSTVVDSSLPIVADRTMTWDKTGYGSHAETAITAPGTTWYLAEGATHGAFDLFYLLQNPGDTDANVTINYLRPAPQTSWFLAEGATGVYFDLYVLIANAEANDAQVTATYLLPDGATVTKNYTIPAHSRITISVQGEDPALTDTPVSTIIQSTNGVPVLVERSMWWPKGNWYEGHLAAGATTTGTKWALAEGEVSSVTGAEVETYVLIANTSDTPGTATVTAYPTFGDPVAVTVDLKAHSRVNVPMSSLVPLSSLIGNANPLVRYFGTIVQSSGPPIVVGRSMYSNSNGVTWAAGTAALGTKLQ